MRKFFTLSYVLLFLVSTLTALNLQAQITMTTTGSHVQNFNGLITTGTGNFIDNTTITGWYSQRTGTGTNYAVETGSSNAGGLYSYGSVSAADRALGTVGSGGATAGNFAHGVLLQNTSGTTITDLRVTYTLEQWRNSAAAAQQVSFYYKKSTTAITALNPNSNATWTLVSGLSLNSPIIGGSAGALDGNAAANRVTATNVSIPGLSLADNEYIMLKWDDPDHTGSDHGLAIDDVTINWTVTPVISSNALLTGLVVNNNAFTSTATLTPTFSSGTNSYTASVSNTFSPIFLSFTKGQANQLVEARINSGTYGSALASFPLNVGNNTIDVKVTAQDNSINIYTLTINRAAASVPILTVSSASTDFGSLCTNTTGGPNSFTLDGSSLNSTNISIAALAGFSYSETVNGVYTSTLSFPTGATLSGKVIYVKFTPANVQPYDGNILISGGGTSASVPATGSGINTTPTVTTVGNIVTGTAGTLTGNITANGCTAVSAYGFEYSTTSGFANGTGIQVTASNLNSGGFSKTVSGLTAGVTYYFKAFAVNDGGTGYGAQQSFTTSAITPIVMASQPLLRFTENFDDITNWSANFATGVGANHFSSVGVNATGTIPDGVKITTATNVFSSSVSGGVQKGTGNIMLLGTGSTDNSTALAIDFYMDFTGVNAGTLSFDWASVNNSTGNRNGSLRVYASNDGVTFTELAAADVINFTNNVPSTGTVSSIALPAIFNNSPTARLRFYYANGTGGGTAPATGSRPKISIDNLTVSGIASTPCATPAAGPSSLNFGTVTETSIQGDFLAASPAVNEYLVIMSTNSSLTSNPIDGQTYFIGDNVGDGTVIAKGSELSFTATGLTGATTYYFFVFPVNSVCTGGPKYLTANPLTDDATTVAGLPSCTAPAAQPTGLVTTASINSVQGSFTATPADEYLVLQSTSSLLSNTPVNGIAYNAGAVIGNATVIQRNGNTSFTASGLNPATQYYYFIFSLNSQGCVNGPVYNTILPLSGSQTTLPLPPCVTPSAQPSDIAFNASNNSVTATFNGTGSGYNYLVVMSTSATLSASPVDNSDYAVGSGLGGGTVVSNNTSTSFIANSLSNSTTYYFFVFSANKNCTGGTKYLTALPLTGNTTTTNAPVNNYYFGNLHAHSDYSDGNKDHPGFTPGDDYNYALGSLGMDFLGISEHNHFSSLDNPGDELANYHLGVAQAAAFNASHTGFLALYGMEWGVISGGGHVVVYGDGLTDLFGWESNVNGHVGPNYDVYVPKSTYLGTEGLFKTVNDYAAKNAFASLAHPNNTDFNNLSNLPYDQSADDAISGVAVESGPATSTNTTYSNPASPMFYLWYFQKLLSKGYHLGPTIDHDNHNTTFGRTTPARTAVIAPSLTQTDIISAIRNMHFYATEDIDARVDFTINTRIMGSIFEDRNAPSISVNLTDPTTSTSGALIKVMFGIPGSNVVPVVIDSVFAGSLSYVDNNLANHATGYYYIDITNNGKRIITSPIWYTRTCAAASDLTATVCGSYTWNGTIYTTSTVATKVFTTAGGCDSTVTLHLTVNNPPASATVSFAGSGNGCPGTGVALTAAVDDGGNGTVNTYQWIKDGNIVATTSTGNYTALTSGNYSVTVKNVNNCSVVSNTVSITVTDNIAPVLSGVPAAVSANCNIPAAPAVTATDNCDNAPVVVFTESSTQDADVNAAAHYNYAITRTWTATDASNNSSSASQVITVSDTQSPVISALANISQNNDPSSCGAVVNFAATATDACSPVIITYSIAPNTIFPVGVTTVTVTATDVSGNSTNADFTVTIVDTEKPTITAPGAYSMASTPGQCGTTISNIGTPVTHDNCGVATVSNDHPSADYPVGTTIVTWTVTDIHGNVTDTAKQSITVIDNEWPTIHVSNVSVANTPGLCGATIVLATPDTHDNCGVASVSNDHTSTFFPTGITTLKWTVTDNNGLVTTATQTVTVTDTENPVANTQPVTVYLDASGNATVTAVQIDNHSTDNCSIASYSLSKTNFSCSDLGANTVTLTVTDASGNTNSKTAVVTVADNTAPSFTTVPAQTFCTNAANTYTIPVLTATDNCSGVSVSYTVSGATTRSLTNSNNASGVFNPGTSTINWKISDGSGNSVTTTTSVTINALPAVVITASGADAFCNKLLLTANATGSGATYKWTSNSSTFATTQQVSLGQSNGDGIYQVTATVGECSSAAATYNFQKQNLISSYTILAFANVDLGENNIVATGSVGVTSANGKIDFDKNSSVSSAGSFVKAKYIDKTGQNIIITNPIYSAATGITLPAMLLNTVNTNGLPNKDVAQNSVSTVSGNYRNLTLKKGSRTVVTGNVFGTVRVEQGAQLTFTATSINIDKLQVVKGPRYGYSYVRFAADTKVMVSTSVSIGSQVYINPDNNKVTFYMGDTKSDDEKFAVKGGDTKVTANVYVPNGTLRVSGGYRYGDYGNGTGDCDRDDDEDKYYGQGTSYVNMTGLFIAEQVVGNGKNVIWNSFDCTALPVPVLNTTTVTQTNTTDKEVITTEEDLKVTVSPNPSTTYFTLKIESKYETPVNLRVMDSRGRVIDARSQIAANSTLQVGHNYASGTYYAEIIQGTQRKIIQLIKINH